MSNPLPAAHAAFEAVREESIESLNLRVQELTCRTEDDSDRAPCPSPKFVGTEMFGSFQGLPSY